MLLEMGSSLESSTIENEEIETQYLQKGVRHLCERGLTRVPSKYILPINERPNLGDTRLNAGNLNLKLPVIDLTQFQGSDRCQAIHSLEKACREFGFFQVDIHLTSYMHAPCSCYTSSISCCCVYLFMTLNFVKTCPRLYMDPCIISYNKSKEIENKILIS